MKLNFTLSILAMLLLTNTIHTCAQGSLEVTIVNIKEAKGNIRLGLFCNAETFLKETVVGKVVKATEGKMVVTFEDVKAGEYAISLIHDENENAELDTNVLGIPTEGFAFGNNAMGMFGPPSFEEAMLVIKDHTVSRQQISIKYL
jgi:uncharacterized protein (DUF2141 family)